MYPKMEKIPSANSTGAPYVAGNYCAPQERSYGLDLEVSGHIPEELTGRFFRMGPNPVGDPVATMRLPVRIPFTFQGGWAPDNPTVAE